MSGQPPARRRDSASTRQALLDSAATLFAERGFERTTVREIAVHAGANQALLFRYFGSKEALFEEVTAVGARDLLATSKPERLLEDSLRGLLTARTSVKPHGALEALLRSIGTGNAAVSVSQELGDEYARALATLTRHGDADLRADLVLAWLIGIGMLRDVTEREPLASADTDQVCTLVLGAARTLLEDLDTPS